MKTCISKNIVVPALLALLSTLNFQPSTAFAQGTVFTYQGRLDDSGAPANGTNYGMIFYLYDAPTNGNLLGNLGIVSVTVSNGLFTVPLSFGNVFDGTPRWLEISVQKDGGGFTTLSPRQSILPTPYAIMANSASNLLGALPAVQLSGAIPSGNFSGSYTNPLTFNNGSDEFNGTFSGQFFGPLFVGGSFSGAHFGDGSGLYNLNAATLGGLASSNFWKTTGNAGTTAGPNFVGTTDNQPLEVHVNGQRAFQFLPDVSTNNAPDIVGGSPANALTAGLVGTTISGGGWNTIGPSSLFSTNNPYGDNPSYPAIGASYTTIGGGFLNQIQSGGTFSTVSGGALNTIQSGDIETTISGGFHNTILTNASWSTIVGGTYHTIGSVNGSIGGGWLNTIQASSGYSTVAGGTHNTIQTNSGYSAIGGGLYNTVQGNVFAGFIGGGYDNIIGPDGISGFFSSYSVIGGGYFNSIYEFDSFIGGGQQNQIQAFADHSVIGGGANNTIVGSLLQPAEAAVIGGGQNNVVQTNTVSSVIGGGYANTIQSNAFYAVVPGGSGNLAGGTNSFAAGTLAQATNNGAFVWSDTSTTNVFNSTGSNQLLIRAAGGVGIGTNSPAAALHVVAGGGGTNIALRVDNGGLAVSGAGIGTATAAFIHFSSLTNCSGDSTFINNPLCNGDPNALLFVTHNFNPPNAPFNYFNKNFGVWYFSFYNEWAIYTEDLSPMPTNIAFNVLIIKQ